MSLSKQRIATLLGLVGDTKDDDFGCDCCFDRIAEFAEAELEGRSLCAAMESVKTHLESCSCCADEYQALLDALRAIGSEKVD